MDPKQWDPSHKDPEKGSPISRNSHGLCSRPQPLDLASSGLRTNLEDGLPLVGFTLGGVSPLFLAGVSMILGDMVWVCMFVCLYVINVCMYVFMYVCMYVCMYVRI